MNDFFLKISNGWGLSGKPGRKIMQLNDNGSFIIEITFYLPSHQDDNKKFEGTIDTKRVKLIREFLEKNITKDTYKMIHDAGWSIEYKKNERTFTIENDLDLWGKLVELLPEYKQGS